MGDMYMYIKFEEDGSYGFYSPEIHGDEILNDPDYKKIPKALYEEVIASQGFRVLNQDLELEDPPIEFSFTIINGTILQGTNSSGRPVETLIPEDLQGYVTPFRELLEGTKSKEDRMIALALKHASEEEAIDLIEYHEFWLPYKDYKRGDRRQYIDDSGAPKLYECDQAHTSQAGWEPQNTPALWKDLSGRLEEVEDWKQPESNNPYKKGDRVKHKDKTWESTIDGNVWEPGAYGWEVYTS